jgi:cysteinyl-tRNA synthetase
MKFELTPDSGAPALVSSHEAMGSVVCRVECHARWTAEHSRRVRDRKLRPPAAIPMRRADSLPDSPETSQRSERLFSFGFPAPFAYPVAFPRRRDGFPPALGNGPDPMTIQSQIQIYNTLTRKKEPFEPLHPPTVTIYNCGPTVYDHFHIGNARNFVVMDLVRRWFEWRGYKVRFVQNLTDIDDKIISRADEEGITTDQVAAKYIPLYFADADKLRIRKADVHPRATEHVADIVALIARLIDKGLAYSAAGSVYYSVASFPGYGKLSGRRLEDMLDGARVEPGEEKRDPGDFALWKAAKPGEPTWESPWGPGRPGWHIECSCMAMKHLGETVDIHAGGTDLTFPHHENEIAQSEGATGKPFVRFWMHNGFLNIDKKKMSKSLGNFLKIDQVLERASAEAVRHFLLSAHYRSPLDLTDEALDNSASAVRRINEAIDTGRSLLKLAGMTGGASTETDDVRQLCGLFESAMDDDFNTPKALAALFDLVSLIHEVRQGSPIDYERLNALVRMASVIRDLFGLESASAAEGMLAPQLSELMAETGRTATELQLSGDGRWQPDGQAETVDAMMDWMIEARRRARMAKAFAIADKIRDRLADLGILLEDHPQGTIWKRKE